MGRLTEPRLLAPRAAAPLPPSDLELLAASRTGDADADDVVAEAFAKVLAQLRRDRGPDGAFRPYLLTTVRRTAIDRLRAEGKLVVSGEIEAFDPGVPFADPAVAKLKRTMIVRAFASLPERWRAVLWQTEIEDARPAEVAAHLDQCAHCHATYLELADVNVALRGALAPLVLGPATVLDGAHVVGTSGPSLSVPLDGLPPGRQAQVRTVTWTPAGPAAGAFPQNLAERPAVTFATGQNPYLVGVVAVSDAPQGFLLAAGMRGNPTARG